MNKVFLVLIDGPRGEGRVREYDESELQAEWFWQEIGDIFGTPYATRADAEAVLAAFYSQCEDL